MNAQTQSFSLVGAAGPIECKLDLPALTTPQGIALIAHPHPLYGGSLDNKVVQTLARAFLALGYVCARMNFRGVGHSAGVHDHGIGETEDMALLHAHMINTPTPACRWRWPGFHSARLCCPGCSSSSRRKIKQRSDLHWSAALQVNGILHRCLPIRC